MNSRASLKGLNDNCRFIVRCSKLQSKIIGTYTYGQLHYWFFVSCLSGAHVHYPLFGFKFGC